LAVPFRVALNVKHSLPEIPTVVPRIKRIAAPGVVQHVMNRGNRRAVIFVHPADYEAFLGLLEAASTRFAVRLLAYCLMPNHWHLVVWPEVNGAISAYMRWVTGTHVRRHHRQHGLEGTGHLYQGRYTSVPVQGDKHLFSLVRYVEANPLRAGLVSRAQEWPWSSLGAIGTRWERLSDYRPVPRGPEWANWVNSAGADTARIRAAIARGAPFGEEQWTDETARRFGLRFTLRPRGRPPRAT
jgi:putative transposase